MATTVQERQRRRAYELSRERHLAVVRGMLVDYPNAPAAPSAQELANLFAWGSPEATFDESVTHIRHLTNVDILRSATNARGPVNDAHEGLLVAAVLEAALEFDQAGSPVHMFCRPSTVIRYDKRVAAEREQRELEERHAALLSSQLDGLLADVRQRRRAAIIADFRRHVALMVSGDVDLLESVVDLAAQLQWSDNTIRGAVLRCEEIAALTARIDEGTVAGVDANILEGLRWQQREWAKRDSAYYADPAADNPRLHGAVT